MTTLREFIETASHNVEKIFRKTGVIRPMVHCVTRDGEVLVFPSLDGDKDVAALMMRALFELRDVVRYVLIDEAWIVEALGENATPEKIAAVKKAAITGASASPDRVEVVMFCAEDHAEGQLMGRRQIIRPQGPYAKPPYLAPIEIDPEGGMLQGRFVGLLPRPAMTTMQ